MIIVAGATGGLGCSRAAVVAAALAIVASRSSAMRSDHGSYTLVRNGHYIENLPMFLGGSIESGELLLPPDGPTSWVSREDLGEAIARLLLEIAAIVSRALGRSIVRRTVTSDEYVERLVEDTLPRLLRQTRP
jgi:uncharacterized protein YbjT (DUF2867 family)